MNMDVKTLLKNKIVPALLSIALGIVLIIARRAALDVLIKIIGGLIIAGGLAFVAIWLFKPERLDGNMKMAIGPAVIMILFGLALIFFTNTVVDIFPILMGVILILNGIGHLTAAGMNQEDRFLIILLGIITIALGVLIVMQPSFVASAIVVWIGVFFIINGLFDLFMIKRVTGSDSSSEN